MEVIEELVVMAVPLAVLIRCSFVRGDYFLGSDVLVEGRSLTFWV